MLPDRVLSPDYVAFEAVPATAPCWRWRTRVEDGVHKGDKNETSDPIFFKIRYASTLPSAGIPSPDAARSSWAGAETYLEVFR
jgi:hypothetical protein